MDFYFVERDHVMELPIDGQLVTYVFLGCNGNIPADRLYFAPSDEIKRVIDRFKQAGYEDFNVKVFVNQNQIINHPKFPLNLTYTGGYLNPNEKFVPLEEKIKPLLGKEKLRVAIVNGMGGGIGDNIVGMTALNIFYDRLMNYFKEVDIGIFTLRPRGLPILKQETIVNEIYLMPSPTELLFSYDAYVDLSCMTGWPIFRQPFMDFFINAFSIDPQSVPKEQKRCFIKLNERVARELEPLIRSLKSSGKPLLLFHPLTSSQIRSIPPKFAPKYLNKILKLTDYLVISLVDIHFKHPRFFNLSSWSKKSFDHFAYLVSQMDAVITVDTATTHLADAFSVPGVDLCTTIPPKWYVGYYPFMAGILVGGGEFPEIYTHASDKEEDLKKIYEKWRKFRIEDALELLEQMVDKRKKELPYIECPICGHKNPFIATNRYRQYLSTKCSRCEAEYAYPRKAMDYNEAYKQESTESGDQYKHYIDADPNSLFKRLINNQRFEKVKTFLRNIPVKETLLDIGCANGFFVLYAKKIGFSAYGIDASTEAINYGRHKFKLHDRLSACCNLNDLPKNFPNSFQIITAFEVVEHLEDPFSFVQQVYNKLKKNGIFIFSTPNRNTMGRIWGLKDERTFFIPGHRDSPPGHLTRFTLKTHKFLVRRAGFDVLCQWTIPPLIGDLLRTLGDEFKVPQLTIEVGGNKTFNVPSEKLKPIVIKSIEPTLKLLEDQGLFIVTVAIKS